VAFGPHKVRFTLLIFIEKRRVHTKGYISSLPAHQKVIRGAELEGHLFVGIVWDSESIAQQQLSILFWGVVVADFRALVDGFEELERKRFVFQVVPLYFGGVGVVCDVDDWKENGECGEGRKEVGGYEGARVYNCGCPFVIVAVYVSASSL
jgi:hypothetical protein